MSQAFIDPVEDTDYFPDRSRGVMPQPPLTVKEACAQLRIGITKFYELKKAGAIKTMLLGRKRLVDAESVQRFQDSLPDRK
jgi:excisionase family DNA binding protein